MGTQYVIDLAEVDDRQTATVGGKGAHLGALARIGDVHVPAGFCVTTDAYRHIVAEMPSLDDRLDRLARLSADDQEGIRTVSAEIRRAIEGIAVPDDLAEAVTRALARTGERAAYAVRSSATAEDQPTASFAGQQDTYLNVVGAAEILRHITRCWASVFTERAVVYRRRNGVDHRTVHMAVVVQRMVLPDAAGILFTADPVTGDRKTATVDAGFGLGEALVSGLVNPDVFTVRDGAVVGRTIAAKERAVYALPGGGTEDVTVDARRQKEPSLTDDQVVELVRIGRRIEAHFGRPQDIEWCLTGDGFHIVQSRPITTLFPVPERKDGAGDGPENRVYVSVGHQQMMTDAMKPLGYSLWQRTAMVDMYEAGGRLFVDVTPRLAAPDTRAALLDVIGKGDPLTRDALETVIDRGDFAALTPPDGAEAPAGPPPAAATAPPTAPDTGPDPAIVGELIARSEASVAALERDIRTKTGPELFDFLDEAFVEHKKVLSDPLSFRALMAGMDATWWLNDKLREWLGETNAADTLTLSAPDNITSEMGLALLDVADAVRPHPEVVAYLQGVEDEDFLTSGELAALPGGAEARNAIEAYLDRYGARCVGEIDITRPRWRERPTALVPVILDNVRNFGPGAAAHRFEQGRRKAAEKEHDVLTRLRALPDGDAKAEETKRMIDRVRSFIGYREYPKYGIIQRYFVYKQALLGEAERLVGAGVLAEKEDIFHLTFDELRDVVRTHRLDDAGLVQRRKDDFRWHEELTPPRVLTSDGEALTGAYRRDDVPEGALTGLAVSAGTIEGRARVILDIADADLEAGDILVTTFTDPSWSPLFVAVAGLVTEVGGLMTHGAVIAREYGLPAVVGVEKATRLIRDGQRIRVHGTSGYVEILS
ncbi:MULTISPECIES: rifamycin-inactivating phosphotransferase [Streptomyces]|uniref:Rifampicin phosphotransferase n=1 Tax=Streptomyces venezuelae TaxID=54571 RepID=A0A5P2B8M7_STRVZ|nr:MULTISPECIES: rifamycin-inactivating phosphotransferase [Streptomyces]NDZ98838.1 phosphoenolpyruvate synthase [Streptomyces sp. SID10116]MYY80563.1 phosphoenolpyruvate synthase [Streptomyces sp. SID335]MYZ15257.1 phosphoenolpyruvate synthase [Streptomyces sp. SID337]NDZ87408.1 phosphoenolpyruvate synthase [Streptomyces sp. SID10115]NEB43278.1 phosphoenolpyruvate synthase [Streptomyces sp. SID339]